MTNGEKIKEIFPNITERFTNTDEYTNKPTRVEISVGMHILTTISVDVWNVEYKEPTTKNDLGVDAVSRKAVINQIFYSTDNNGDVILGSTLRERIARLPSVTPQEPRKGQYEKHTDHTDCIWYGSDSGCPVTCSQYRDGWNDAMDYIFKNGKGYQPYRHDG